MIRSIAFALGLGIAFSAQAMAEPFYVPGTSRVLAAPTQSWKMEIPRSMKIVIRSIPHADQFYDTVGDWAFSRKDARNLAIQVSRMSDPRYEVLIAVHELVEAMLCKTAGVDQDAVTRFDVAYERARRDGDQSEPGDDSRAPYHAQHVIASEVERLLADRWGVDWSKYSAEIEGLSQ